MNTGRYLYRFQSTCPARGTTEVLQTFLEREVISIHVPREGHDLDAFLVVLIETISIHVPREGHDELDVLLALVGLRFQSTCPARGTTA